MTFNFTAVSTHEVTFVFLYHKMYPQRRSYNFIYVIITFCYCCDLKVSSLSHIVKIFLSLDNKNIIRYKNVSKRIKRCKAILWYIILLCDILSKYLIYNLQTIMQSIFCDWRRCECRCNVWLYLYIDHIQLM